MHITMSKCGDSISHLRSLIAGAVQCIIHIILKPYRPPTAVLFRARPGHGVQMSQMSVPSFRPESRLSPSPRAKHEAEVDMVTFVVRGQTYSEQVPRKSLTDEVSPVLRAMVEERQDDDTFRRGEQDSQGRYVLEGPTNAKAFSLLVECVRQGGNLPQMEMAKRIQDLDLEARVEACRYLYTPWELFVYFCLYKTQEDITVLFLLRF